MRPRAAAISLLRVLEANPETLGVLSGNESPPTPFRAPSPFEVQARNLKDLRPEEVHEFLRRLLNVEAQAHGIPLDGIHVSQQHHRARRREDGRISWRAGQNARGSCPLVSASSS